MTTDSNPKLARKQKQDRKAQLRRQILSGLPKGGLCAEVGVWRGGFTRMILNQIQPDKLLLIDPWENFEERTDAFDGTTDDAEFEKIYQSVCDKYAPEIESGKVEVKRGLSVPVFKKMEKNSFSFVYLDGDHSYEGVKADLKAVLPLMKPGGIIMLDDYHRRGWWGDGVIRATNEFIGENAANLRVTAMRGAQIAIGVIGDEA
jgi:hypothetical protein